MELRYITLYEAFQSSTLSKVKSYIQKKFGVNSAKKFITDLTHLGDSFNIPISQIRDIDIKYLNRKQAINLKNDDLVSNKFGIWCIKFWFSVENGYLTYTGTGNKKIPFNNNLFDDDQINYIKNSLNITTGELKPVDDYTKLQHGDWVIGNFGCRIENELIRKARIWKQNGILYAIQDLRSGGEPNGEWRAWADEDPSLLYSWCLGHVDDPGGDHNLLHFYKKSDKPLNYNNNNNNINPLSWNLPIDNNELVSWKTGGKKYKDLNFADFAVVIILDDIFNSDIKSKSDIINKRNAEKSGAYKLLSDETVRNINFENYLNKIIKKFIDIDISQIKDLDKILLNNICNEYSYFSIKSDDPSLAYSEDIMYKLYKFISSSKEEEIKKNFLLDAVYLAKNMIKDKQKYTLKYKKSFEFIKKEYYNNEDIKEIFEIFLRIGKKINDFLSNEKIETIEELRLMHTKLKSIKEISLSNELRLRSYINDVIFMSNKGDLTYLQNIMDENKDRPILEDIKRMKHIEKYVNSIFK